MKNDGVKDAQTVASGGRMLQDLIDGVQIHEMSNIITRNGVTTELVRPEWEIGSIAIRHMIHVTLHAHAISAWHCHQGLLPASRQSSRRNQQQRHRWQAGAPRQRRS